MSQDVVYFGKNSYLFQEVPGCSNCTRYGNTILTDPLIVEAIEDCFVPVCIYNNNGGADKEALVRYQEPAWNNPVVRIVNASGRDLVARMPDFTSVQALVNGMRRALEQSGQTPPAYLRLLEEELTARAADLATATFQMYCFWSGEGVFGGIPGVIETSPGFQDGHEVVQVQYHPGSVSQTQLEALTKPEGIQSCAKNDGFRTDREPKYYLSRTKWKSVPMTSLQACRANTLVGQGKSPESVLSPRQIALYKTLSDKSPNMIGVKNLADAWKRVGK